MNKRYFFVLAVLVAILFVVGAAAVPTFNYRAHLSGDNEVPPVATNAGGNTHFYFNATGSLTYKVILHSITDVVAAHVHCAPTGVNGPIGITMYEGEPAGAVHGILVIDTITAPDAGNACGWVTIADVQAAIESSNAYVNVHTVAYPTGEIRGQIE